MDQNDGAKAESAVKNPCQRHFDLAKLADLTDEQLVILAQQESSDALSVLIDRYGELFLRVAKRILQNDEDAEDVVQDFWYEILWRIRIDRFDPEIGTLKNYMFTCVANASKTAREKRNRKRERAYGGDDPAHVTDPPDHGSGPLEELVGREEANRLQAKLEFQQGVAKAQAQEIDDAIEKLPPGEKAAMKLYVQGYTHQEIAQILGLDISEGASKTRVCRAVEKIALALGIEPQNVRDIIENRRITEGDSKKSVCDAVEKITQTIGIEPQNVRDIIEQNQDRSQS